MYSTDSINSYQGVQHDPSLGCGVEGIRDSGQKLPKDVLEALEEHDLEKAMELLREHEVGENEVANQFLPNLMKMITRTFSFNFISAGARSARAKRGKSSRKQAAKVAIRDIGKISKRFAKLLLQSMRRTGKAVRAMAANLRRAGTAAGRHIFKPAARMISRQLVRSFNALRESSGFFGRAVGKFSESMRANYKDIRVKIAEKLENAQKEIRELTKSTKELLTQKFENFTDRQEWMKAVIGQQMLANVTVAINVMAHVMVPFVFGAKQARKGKKLLQKGMKKVKAAFNQAKNAFRRGKNWVKGKLKKARAYFQPVIEACVIAIDRIWRLVCRKLWAYLKKLWIWATSRISSGS